MILVPAIDLKQGRCVRLFQGQYENETEYSRDPVKTAIGFEAQGAKRLHVVDLDGAVLGESGNFSVISEICAAVNIQVEIGGGIRDLKTAQRLLDAGVSEVILGTIVIQEPEEARLIIRECGADFVQVGLDFKENEIGVRGWREMVPGSVNDEIKKWQGEGISRFILTDITKDGTMNGPNIESLEEIARNAEAKITAAGGISCPQDVYTLQKLEKYGVDRVISGKAIYENKIMLKEFI